MQRFLFIILIVFFPLTGRALVFERSLSLGMQGEDVRELQKTLNKDPLTRISETGPGSLGNETTYFGALTKNAVIKFQDLYAPEVLFPIYLHKGTGFVGPYTIAKLNNIKTDPGNLLTSVDSVGSIIPVGVVPPPALATVENSPSISILSNTAPKIFNLSRYSATPGMEVVVSGDNFDRSKNTIIFSGVSQVLTDIPSIDSRTISFIVPTWIPLGSYNLSIVNSKGTSFDRSFGNYFSVSDKVGELPKIFSVSPQNISVSSSQEIVIIGENFDKEDNIVISSLGSVSSVKSSDGKILKIRLGDFSSFSQIETASKNIKTKISPLSIFFHVKTSAGLSLEPVSLMLAF